MKIAAITMAYNESIYLPMWCRYYGNALGIHNIFVIDHGSDDGSSSTIPAGANLIKIPRAEKFDEMPRTKFVTNFQKSLIQYYDAVIYSDADEYIVPDPSLHADFASLLKSGENVMAPIGLNVFHATDRESAIDLRRPILGQRKFCEFSSAMCKPTITKVPIEWSLGFHGSNHCPEFREDVFLYHLKSMDLSMSLRRLAKTRSMAWSQNNIDERISYHHRIDDDIHIREFFSNQIDKLKKTGGEEFAFSTELEELKATCRVDGNFHHYGHFARRVTEIPSRFWGLV